MLTPTHVSNVTRPQSSQTSQDVRRASVEGFTVPRQGAIESYQLPVRIIVPQGEPAAFKPSSTLKKRALDLLKEMPKDTLRPKDLQQATERMVLEGKYIQEARQHATAAKDSGSITGFEKIGRDLGLTSRLADEVEARRILISEQLAQIVENQKPAAEQVREVSQCLKEAIEHQTELFAKRTAVYEEVLKQPGLSKADRAAILDSELSFSSYAAKTNLDVPQMVGAAKKKADSISDTLKESENAAARKGNHDQAAQLKAEAKEWKTISQQLKSIQDYLGEAANNAVSQARLAHIVDELSKSSASMGNQAHALLGQASRQIELSGLALGAANSFTEAALSDWPGAQQIVGALATAIAHEVGTHLLGSLILEAIGGATQPVSAALVLPSPNRFVSVQGEVRPRRPEELEEEKNKVLAKRIELSHVQNAHKLGSLEGDARAWTQFALAQGGRGAASIFTSSGGPGDATLASMFAGLLMGSIHAVGGLRARVEDGRGRSIPAYAMKPPEAGALSKRLKQVGADGLDKLNYLKEAPRKTVQDKTSSLAAALASTKILNLATDAVVNNSHAAQSAVTGIATGAKSILLLSQYWAGLQIGTLTKTDALANRTAGRRLSGANYDRVGTAWRNITEPNRSAVPHATELGSKARLAENAYTIWQGASQLVPTAISDTVESTPTMIRSAASRIGESVKDFTHSMKRPRNTDAPHPEEHMMVDLEAQRPTREQ